MNCRTIMEIKDSEQRAHAQAKTLQAALDEHSLELRVRAANEAEAACQQRLSAAEAEMAELRAKMDSSQRFGILYTHARACAHTHIRILNCYYAYWEFL